ncbi:hypothetical protein ACFWFI_02730 [Streptomyces sp. NPDC060209]|uniref:hypothetical protein n=1 Tax=Streptomyces sp. NPDC060209 TaxID=3347073 RepID=UPI00365D3C96
MLLLVALSSCLAAGCSPDPGSPADNDRPQQKKAASPQGPPHRDLSPAEEIEVDRAEQDLVTQCMQRQGFRYWPLPVLSAPARKVGAYVVDDVAWAHQYGYGRSFDNAAQKANRDHPNITYVEALPKKERVRYSRSLDGTFTNTITIDLPSGGSVRTPRGGCYAQAKEQLYGDYPTWFRAKKTVTSLTPLYVPRILQDERLTSVVTAWARCMTAAGQPFQSPDAIRRERESLIRGMTEAQALRSESTLAVTEAQCAQKTSLGKTARALEAEYRDKVARDYTEEFTAYRQMRLSALTRARSL